MSFAPRELASLLANNPAASGVVVEITGDAVRVATRSGAVPALAGTPRLAPGDRVMLIDGRAVLAPKAVASYPV